MLVGRGRCAAADERAARALRGPARAVRLVSADAVQHGPHRAAVRHILARDGLRVDHRPDLVVAVEDRVDVAAPYRDEDVRERAAGSHRQRLSNARPAVRVDTARGLTGSSKTSVHMEQDTVFSVWRPAAVSSSSAVRRWRFVGRASSAASAISFVGAVLVCRGAALRCFCRNADCNAVVTTGV